MSRRSSRHSSSPLSAYATAFLDSNIWKISLKDAAVTPTKVIASTRIEMQPNFSPDGSRLAFVSNQDGVLAIWVSSADGKDPVRLASVPTGGGTPGWSPSGKEIVFDSNERGSWNIVVIGAEGDHEVWLTDGGSDGKVLPPRFGKRVGDQTAGNQEA